MCALWPSLRCSLKIKDNKKELWKCLSVFTHITQKETTIINLIKCVCAHYIIKTDIWYCAKQNIPMYRTFTQKCDFFSVKMLVWNMQILHSKHIRQKINKWLKCFVFFRNRIGVFEQFYMTRFIDVCVCVCALPSVISRCQCLIRTIIILFLNIIFLCAVNQELMCLS